MGLLQIRDRLNADPDRYPPPVPVDPATARGAWSRSSVWEVLRNPKYTGYQVWNRRARKKGHNWTNPPEAWIWSEEPAHPAIVSREEHGAVQARAKANERSRQGVPATTARPTAKTNYLYRGLLRCGICGLRMWGNHRRNTTYYSCQPSHQRSKDIPVGHPSHVYLNEQRLNDALLPFLATALFGPERTDYWRPACRSSPACSTRRPRANCGRCSTRYSSTSSTSRPTAPSMSQLPSTISAATASNSQAKCARRTGRRPRQDSNLRTRLRRPVQGLSVSVRWTSEVIESPGQALHIDSR
jgi:hypothetical protein